MRHSFDCNKFYCKIILSYWSLSDEHDLISRLNVLVAKTCAIALNIMTVQIMLRAIRAISRKNEKVNKVLGTKVDWNIIKKAIWGYMTTLGIQTNTNTPNKGMLNLPVTYLTHFPNASGTSATSWMKIINDPKRVVFKIKLNVIDVIVTKWCSSISQKSLRLLSINWVKVNDQ